MLKYLGYIFPTADNQEVSYRKFYSIAALLVCGIEIIRILGFITFPISNLINIVFLLPLLCGIIQQRFSIEKLYVVYIIYLILNILITNPHPVFQSWMRLVFFLVILIPFSPIFENFNLRFFRLQCFKWFMCLVIPLSVLSFFCYFLNINYFVTEIENVNYIEYVGAFSGLFAHSMMLGPLAAISTIVLIWLGLKRNRIYFIFALMTFGTTLFGASRGATISLLIGILILLIFYTRKKSKSIAAIIVVVGLLSISYPLWDGPVNRMLKKNERSESSMVFDSRTAKYLARFSEIKSNPLFGVGFCAIKYNGIDVFNVEKGTVEPGSSWLAVLSMTGIIGLIFFLLILYNAIKSAYKSKTIYRGLYLSLLTFFLIHFLSEGYIFAGGNVLCFFFWLLLGCSEDLRYIISKK